MTARDDMHAHHDKTILDLLRLCPEGVSSKSLVEVCKDWPDGSVSSSLRRLSEQHLIEARRAADATTRWFWLVPVAYQHRYAPRSG